MAVKWAVANGNWSNGTTWNDGSVPVDGDYVYCNNHVITLDVVVNQPNTTISNDVNISLSIIQGGYVVFNVSVVNANFENSGGASDSLYIIRSSGSASNIVINGNVNCGSLILNSSNTRNYIINGNVTTKQNSALLSQTIAISSITINGNVTINGLLAVTHNTLTEVALTTPFSVNGTIKINHPISQYATNFYINGILRYAQMVSIKNLHINGRLEYENTTTSILLRTDNLNIQNPDTFTWKDVTEPRSNPFIILTDAEMNNRQQYPAEDKVKQGTEYVWGEKVGTYLPDYPPESVVLKDFEYGDSDDRKTGTMEQEVNVEVGCVTPEDVRKDVPLVGMGVVGSLVVPSVDDVREGVVFDNGSVGTLIVQGGGDRLRIADFGYYTNAQSDTYIVDLTEQDKPKFAVAEERVLIEMFPDLDLDNIPDKYFDDLFVKYLKYRLIVEYYRTAGINSTFTPSEPTTEIVNYQNVRNEVWLNSANIYLKAWSKKYPESIVKPQRILL